VGEERDRVHDECVSQRGRDAAGGGERGDALEGGAEEQAQAVRIARGERASLLPLADQFAECGE